MYLSAGGFYCTVGTITPVSECSAGYYCRNGATVSTPDQGTDANVCPAGYFCEQGTTEPEHCPVGTYSNDTGLVASSLCSDCDPGNYVNG